MRSCHDRVRRFGRRRWLRIREIQVFKTQPPSSDFSGQFLFGEMRAAKSNHGHQALVGAVRRDDLRDRRDFKRRGFTVELDFEHFVAQLFERRMQSNSAIRENRDIVGDPFDVRDDM